MAFVDTYDRIGPITPIISFSRIIHKFEPDIQRIDIQVKMIFPNVLYRCVYDKIKKSVLRQ